MKDVGMVAVVSAGDNTSHTEICMRNVQCDLV